MCKVCGGGTPRCSYHEMFVQCPACSGYRRQKIRCDDCSGASGRICTFTRPRGVRHVNKVDNKCLCTNRAATVFAALEQALSPPATDLGPIDPDSSINPLVPLESLDTFGPLGPFGPLEPLEFGLGLPDDFGWPGA